MTLPRFSKLLAMTLATGALLATSAPAQRYDDDRGRGASSERNVAGEFDYYTLVLSWSPTYCSEKDDDGYDPQCDRQDGRRYAFVLHGLWPQYTRGYPERCWTRKKPFVPEPLIQSMLDIMPSPKLVIHEYRKHGTCSGLDPAQYYSMSRKLFRSIDIPDRYVNPYEAVFVTPAELEDDLLEANPELEPEMISITCGGAGNRVREVRICFSKEGLPTACGPNEEQRRLCNAQRMYMPPVRSSRIDPDSPEDREKAKRTENPRPRLLESVTGR